MVTHSASGQAERGNGTGGRWASLALFTLCVVIAASVGGLFTRSGVAEWYQSIHKPVWTPPDWLFGPVWTVLYASMAIAAWLVWLSRGHKPVLGAMVAFFVQLALNATWSALFFGLRSPLAGLVDIAFLLGAIAATIILFWRVRIVAGVLIMPYFLWVAFAAALNAAIWRLNS